MQKTIITVGLAGLASAAVSYSPPAYSASSPAGYTSTPVVGSSSAPAGPASSSPAGYSTSPVAYSSASPVTSSTPAVYSTSSGVVFGSSASAVYSASVSSAVPSSTPFPSCWSSCFQQAGVTSEADLCGNTAVDQCIQNDCTCEEDKAYWAWYDSFCPAVSYTTTVPSIPTSSAVVYSVTGAGSVSASATPSASAIAGCWSVCFAKAGITSESELCGNTEVDECIHDTCSCEEDKAYWQWYNGYCTATSSSTSPVTYSATVSVSSTPSATPTGSCWDTCFAENNISSESELCGNTAVDKCIQDTCSISMAQSYWSWYDSYCAAPSTSTVVTSVATGATTYATTFTTTWGTVPPSETTGVPVPPVAPTYPAAPGLTPYPTTSAVSSGWGATATPTGWAPVPATGGAEALAKPGFFFAAAMAVAALL